MEHLVLGLHHALVHEGMNWRLRMRLEILWSSEVQCGLFGRCWHEGVAQEAWLTIYWLVSTMRLQLVLTVGLDLQHLHL